MFILITICNVISFLIYLILPKAGWISYIPLITSAFNILLSLKLIDMDSNVKELKAKVTKQSEEFVSVNKKIEKVNQTANKALKQLEKDGE